MFRINYRSSFLSEKDKLAGVQYMVNHYPDRELFDLMQEFAAGGYTRYYLMAKSEVIFRMGCSTPHSKM